MRRAGYIFFMQIKKLKGELLYKDVFAVAPLKKQQMCAGADPEASRSGGPAALKALSSMEASRWEEGRADGPGCAGTEESGYEGRGPYCAGISRRGEELCSVCCTEGRGRCCREEVVCRRAPV